MINYNCVSMVIIQWLTVRIAIFSYGTYRYVLCLCSLTVVMDSRIPFENVIVCIMSFLSIVSVYVIVFPSSLPLHGFQVPLYVPMYQSIVTLCPVDVTCPISDLSLYEFLYVYINTFNTDIFLSTLLQRDTNKLYTWTYIMHVIAHQRVILQIKWYTSLCCSSICRGLRCSHLDLRSSWKRVSTS